LKYCRDDWITSALRAPVIHFGGGLKACSMQMNQPQSGWFICMLQAFVDLAVHFSNRAWADFHKLSAFNI
jgi:hypothetical protein